MAGFMEPGFDSVAGEGSLRIAVSGAWTAGYVDGLERIIDDIQSNQARAFTIDIAGIQKLDTFGAWAIERILRGDGKQRAALVGVAEQNRGLLQEVYRVNRQKPAERARGGTISDRLEGYGRKVAEFGLDLVDIVSMFGQLMFTAARAVRNPTAFRLMSIVHHLDRVAVRAVPIIVMITFLIGCIIAQQGFLHFRKFGAEDYVVDLVAILVLREIGVLLVTIMVAGRSGSSYTAELGSMKMREEIDALRTMGFDPTEILILPRVIALVIAVPMLTFIGTIAALYGGGLVAWLYADMSPSIYIARLSEALSIDHFEVGMIKAPFMALVVGVVASCEGLKVAGSAESLGLRTTDSVVKSIFLVIVLDGIFAVFFASIGL
jgi:phospholipid/cholesterol/gamma-HCH transport system permease protein